MTRPPVFNVVTGLDRPDLGHTVWFWVGLGLAAGVAALVGLWAGPGLGVALGGLR